MFKKFKSLVEKESGNAICCLRTDRGGEFTSQEFNEFCSSNGISRQLTVAYTPQQNGVAERRNRTIMNMVCCMLLEKKVPKEFWPKAINWTVHLLNRCPTLAVKDKTPEEAWCGFKPLVDQFRVFGCIRHVHIPDCKRQKLDDKSFRCAFLGLSGESKAYIMYNPVSKKIIISRDVVFEEEKKWDWGTIVEGAECVGLECGDANVLEENAAERVCEEEEQFEEEQVEDDDTSSSLDEDDYMSPVQGRIRKKPTCMEDYTSGEGLSEEEGSNLVLFTTASNDPMCFEDTVKTEKWKEVMTLETKSIEKNGTWELTALPVREKTIGVKWIFKTKLNEKGEVEKYKARLVAKGYTQRFGIDYNEVFAPVARWDTIRIILALAACKGWIVYQLDVKSAFLHGELIEVVFIEQPQGFEVKGEETKVYKIKKALYGPKQAPRAWYSKLESFFINEGFQRCSSEHTLFTKAEEGRKFLVVSVYVDDLIYSGNDETMFKRFKHSMKQEFDMSDLGRMKYFLGVEVVLGSEGIFISQRKYANEVLERFGMEQCNPVENLVVLGFKLGKDEVGTSVDATTYKQMVGSLMYLNATKPDLAYVLSLINMFMERPTNLHQ